MRSVTSFYLHRAHEKYQFEPKGRAKTGALIGGGLEYIRILPNIPPPIEAPVSAVLTGLVCDSTYFHKNHCMTT